MNKDNANSNSRKKKKSRFDTGLTVTLKKQKDVQHLNKDG